MGESLDEALVEREPLTVICSDKGWIRALKGHVEDTSSLIYKEGDSSKFTVKCMSTDKIMLFTSSGKFFTLEASKLPGGRGAGEPVRLLADVDAADVPDPHALALRTLGYNEAEIASIVLASSPSSARW